MVKKKLPTLKGKKMRTQMTFPAALRHYYNGPRYNRAQLNTLARRAELCDAWDNWVEEETWNDEFKNLEALVCAFFENAIIDVEETDDVFAFLRAADAYDIDGPYYWFEIDEYIAGVLRMVGLPVDDDDDA